MQKAEVKVRLATGADGLFGWTPEKTKAYIVDRPLAIGDHMLVVNQQAGFEEYVLATVVNPASGRQRRIILDKAAAYGGTTFYASGKNCFSPRGQSIMIPPVPEVVSLILSVAPRDTIMSNRHYGVAT